MSTNYPDCVRITQKLFRQQCEINQLKEQLSRLKTAAAVIMDDRCIQSNSDEFVVLSLTIEEWRAIRDAIQAM